jgi:hypothetical protein
MPPNNEKSFNRMKSKTKKSDETENYIEVSSESEVDSTSEEEVRNQIDDSDIYTCEHIVEMKCKASFYFFVLNFIFLYKHYLKYTDNPKTKRNEYLLKWLGYPSSVNTWEPIENILLE